RPRRIRPPDPAVLPLPRRRTAPLRWLLPAMINSWGSRPAEPVGWLRHEGPGWSSQAPLRPVRGVGDGEPELGERITDAVGGGPVLAFPGGLPLGQQGAD